MSYCEEWSPWSDDSISDEIVEKLLKIATVKKCNEGNIIFLERQSSNLYLLLYGTVEISLISKEGRKRILAVHKARTFIDDALVSGSYCALMIECLSRVEFAMLEQEALTKAAYSEPVIFDCILRSVVFKLQGLTQHLADQTFSEVEDRIYNLFLNLTKKHGRKVENGICIEKRLTHELIAGMVGSTRVRVTKSLKSLHNKGKIQRHNKYYVICQDK